MPTRSEDIEKVKALRKQAGETNKRMGSLTAESKTFSDRVMGRVRQARAERGTSQLATDIGTTTGQIISAPADMRARTANVNPLQVDALTARQSAQTLGTLTTQANVEAGRTNTIEGILGAGTNQLLAAAEQKKAEADAATQEANSMVEAIRLRMEEERHKLDQALGNKKLGEVDPEEKAPQERITFANEVTSFRNLLDMTDPAIAESFDDDVAGLGGDIAKGALTAEEAMQILKATYQIESVPEEVDTGPTLVDRIGSFFKPAEGRVPGRDFNYSRSKGRAQNMFRK